MSSVDAAFKNAGKKPGIEIWRIEKLKVVAITDQDKFGKFHTGDSYIVLYTEKTSSGYKWDIHFWLGSETTQDEAGVAAYKTVELDDSLGGAPIQHREVQGHESQQFQNLFKSYGGLRYLAGGVESGFKKVDRDAYEKRLLHIKGKRNVRVAQVEVSHKSLNRGDVFILDIGLTLYQWNGQKASKAERAKGLDVIRDIRDKERGGKAKIIIIEDGQDDDTQFFQDLGGKGPIKEAVDDDAEFENKKNAALKLYRVSDASGSLKVEEAGSSPLKKEYLDSNDCFILDTAQQLFVWIGKKATKNEKNSAWTFAQKFIVEKKYPAYTPCTRIPEGGETALFVQQFASWPKPESSPNYSAVSGNIARVQKKEVDVNKLVARGKPEREKAVDDGSGKLEIWRVEDFKKVPVDSKQYGQFYQGDSYVLMYTYLDKQKKEAYIIYFWQGLDSSQDEKGASALLAKELDDQFGGAPVQVRVVQNKEPEHFLTLFKGKFIIHKGGKASGFKNSTEQDKEATGDVRLYHVRGTTQLNTKATQVEEKASSLNSNDCFVLLTPKVTYAWLGKFSTGDERNVAVSVAQSLGKNVENVFEGSEKEDFWKALGGKTAYNNVINEAAAEFEPRLFQCSNATGNFEVEEIFDFTQEDLVSDDIMLLDAWSEVYLWIGNGANAEEKKMSLETAIQYLKNSPGRNPDNTPILTVKQGFEPPLFTCHFVWDYEKAKSGIDDYDKLKALLESGGGATTAAEELAKYSKTYPYEELLKRPLPDGVDPVYLENHLQEEDFKKVFNLSHQEFMALPKWKRDGLKKEKKLF